MPKGTDVTAAEYDMDSGEDHRNSRVNKQHAREHKPHVSANNSTAPHKPKKIDFGPLGMHRGGS